MVLSRFVVWHPERVQKLVFLSAGYCAPGIFFDVDGLNVLSQKQLGYMQLGYWYFFNSYDAEEIMSRNVCVSRLELLDLKVWLLTYMKARIVLPSSISGQ